jgi:hypothetical protein
MRGLKEYHGGAELDDDAVLVCLDWLNEKEPDSA